MEHGFMRHQDRWQAFPDEKSKMFAIFYRKETGSRFTVHVSRFTVRRSGGRSVQPQFAGEGVPELL
jgi:hypothetical protein